MNVDYGSIYKLACDFQREVRNDKWEALFDYANEVGYANVHEPDNEQRFCTLFADYLGACQVFRRNMRREDVPKLLRDCRDEFQEYLREPTEDNLVAAWKKCENSLDRLHKERRASGPTPVIISKVIMGLGGRFPALDKHFLEAMTRDPLLMWRGIETLVCELEACGFAPLKTPGGRPIPWARVGYGPVDEGRTGRRFPSSAMRLPFVVHRSSSE